MERRSRSSSKRNISSSSKHLSLNMDSMIQGFHQLGQKQNSRTLSPDRRSKPSLSSSRDLTFPKTSPHHSKAGSYNQYNHPALTLPTSSSIALGVNGTSKSSLPAPPPRAPVTSISTANGSGDSVTSSHSSSSMCQKDSLRFSSSPQQQVNQWFKSDSLLSWLLMLIVSQLPSCQTKGS